MEKPKDYKAFAIFAICSNPECGKPVSAGQSTLASDMAEAKAKIFADQQVVCMRCRTTTLITRANREFEAMD